MPTIMSGQWAGACPHIGLFYKMSLVKVMHKVYICQSILNFVIIDTVLDMNLISTKFHTCVDGLHKQNKLVCWSLFIALTKQLRNPAESGNVHLRFLVVRISVPRLHFREDSDEAEHQKSVLTITWHTTP